jgi:hypothetical protein
LFDQKTRPFRCRLGVGRGIAFDMGKRGYDRDLKLDLLATQSRSSGQRRNLFEGPCKLSYGLNQR